MVMMVMVVMMVVRVSVRVLLGLGRLAMVVLERRRERGHGCGGCRRVHERDRLGRSRPMRVLELVVAARPVPEDVERMLEQGSLRKVQAPESARLGRGLVRRERAKASELTRTAIPSLTPPLLPGRATSSALRDEEAMIPHSGLDSEARWVFDKPYVVSACERDGSGFVMSGVSACNRRYKQRQFSRRPRAVCARLLTCTVTSLTPHPVPPLVMMRSTSSASAHPLTAAWIWWTSSWTMAVLTSKKSEFGNARRVEAMKGPVVSRLDDDGADAVSETGGERRELISDAHSTRPDLARRA